MRAMRKKWTEASEQCGERIADRYRDLQFCIHLLVFTPAIGPCKSASAIRFPISGVGKKEPFIRPYREPCVASTYLIISSLLQHLQRSRKSRSFRIVTRHADDDDRLNSKDLGFAKSRLLYRGRRKYRAYPEQTDITIILCLLWFVPVFR